MQGHTVYDVGILDLEIWITVGAKRGSYPYGFGRDGAIPDSGYLPYRVCSAVLGVEGGLFCPITLCRSGFRRRGLFHMEFFGC